jgi:hypothetical protein
MFFPFALHTRKGMLQNKKLQHAPGFSVCGQLCGQSVSGYVVI